MKTLENNFLEKIRNYYYKFDPKTQARIKLFFLASGISFMGTNFMACDAAPIDTDLIDFDDDYDGIPISVDDDKYIDNSEYDIPCDYFFKVKPQSGDSLSKIALDYDSTLEDILAINDIKDPNFITTDMEIIVPVNSCKYKDRSKNVQMGTGGDWSDELDNKGYVKGIDVSAVGQSNMDLDKVLKQNPDIKFVMIRMAYFVDHSKHDKDGDWIDDNFYKYALACKNNNVPMGIYFWPSFENPTKALEEVEIVIKCLDKLRKEYGIYLEMPVAIDIEEKKDGGGSVVPKLLEKDQTTMDAVLTTISALQERGYYTSAYISNSVLRNHPEMREFIESLDVDTWLPRYADGDFDIKDNPLVLQPSYDATNYIRQYSQKGKVNGYNGVVDLNVCYLNFPKVIRDNGLNKIEKIERNKTLVKSND